jgi:hypothetical protein
MSDNAIQLSIIVAALVCLMIRKCWRPALWFGMGIIVGWCAVKVGRAFSQR